LLIIIITTYYNYNCIINSQYNNYIIFLIQASSKYAIGKKMEVNGGCSCFPFEKKNAKRFVQCHVFSQSPPGRCPNDKMSSQHFALLPICVKIFHPQYYLVAYVIHTQSQRSQICVCVHIHFTIYTHWSGKRNKRKWDSSVCRVPRKSFRMPFWARVP